MKTRTGDYNLKNDWAFNCIIRQKVRIEEREKAAEDKCHQVNTYERQQHYASY